MEFFVQMLLRDYRHLINALHETKLIEGEVPKLEDISARYLVKSHQRWTLDINAGAMSCHVVVSKYGKPIVKHSESAKDLRDYIHSQLHGGNITPDVNNKIGREFRSFLSGLDTAVEKRNKAVEAHIYPYKDRLITIHNTGLN